MTRSGLDTSLAAALDAQWHLAFQWLVRQAPPGSTRPTLASRAIQPIQAHLGYHLNKLGKTSEVLWTVSPF